MAKKPLVDALKKVLADSYALYLKTQNYHWNVEGPHFRSLHLLFEEQYTDLAEAIDGIAELIRSLGAKAPGNWKTYEELTNIKDGNENADAVAMIRDLLSDQEKITTTLQQALTVAQEANDEAVVDMLIERLAAHKKNGWMLKSSI